MQIDYLTLTALAWSPSAVRGRQDHRNTLDKLSFIEANRTGMDALSLHCQNLVFSLSLPLHQSPTDAHNADVPVEPKSTASRNRYGLSFVSSLIGFALLIVSALPLAGREKDKIAYGEGLIVNIPMPANEVEKVVEDVAENGVIRGTKEYNKDEYVSGAKAADSSRVFPEWTEGGKVFYKVREHAVDPRNFKDSSDVGTLVVRYVVTPQGDKNTVLRIDARFEEDFRRTVHKSSGAVESAEYKDIQEHLEAIEVIKQQDAEAEKEHREQLAKRQKRAVQREMTVPVQSSDLAADPGGSSPGGRAGESSSRGASMAVSEPVPSVETKPGQSVQDRVKELRQQVERMVKSPGAPLKSAPFHTARTLTSLTTGAEVLILISTPYWYGVETHDGQHGWIMRDQLEEP